MAAEIATRWYRQCFAREPERGTAEHETEWTQATELIWKLAGATGLEPATFGVTGRRSNQLSYAPADAVGS